MSARRRSAARPTGRPGQVAVVGAAVEARRRCPVDGLDERGGARGRHIPEVVDRLPARGAAAAAPERGRVLPRRGHACCRRGPRSDSRGARSRGGTGRRRARGCVDRAAARAMDTPRAAAFGCRHVPRLVFAPRGRRGTLRGRGVHTPRGAHATADAGEHHRPGHRPLGLRPAHRCAGPRRKRHSASGVARATRGHEPGHGAARGAPSPAPALREGLLRPVEPVVDRRRRRALALPVDRLHAGRGAHEGPALRAMGRSGSRICRSTARRPRSASRTSTTSASSRARARSR